MRRAALVAAGLCVSACASAGGTRDGTPAAVSGLLRFDVRVRTADGAIVAERSVTTEPRRRVTVDLGTSAVTGVPERAARRLGAVLAVAGDVESESASDAIVAFDVAGTVQRPAPGGGVVRVRTDPVRIVDRRDLPCTATLRYAGVRRIALSGKVESAVVTTPDGDVLVEIGVARVPRGAGGSASAGSPVVPEDDIDLAAMCAAARGESATRRLVVACEKVGDASSSLVCGTVTDPREAAQIARIAGDAVATWQSPELVLDTLVVPGVRLERRIETAYVRGWTDTGAADVVRHASGLQIDVHDDSRFRGYHVRWTSDPDLVQTLDTVGRAVEVPRSTSTGAAGPVTPGESSFPLWAFAVGSAIEVNVINVAAASPR